MCTVLLGRDVTAPGEIVIAANRDEDPARPSDPPRVLLDAPRLVGGRDRVAGGTWMAVRVPPREAAGRAEGEAFSSVTMLLNRPPLPGAPAPARSRGLLVIDVARADDPRAVARAEAASGRYGPCTLLHASPAACWWVAVTGGGVHEGEIGRGWHAITHAELDDPHEPRTAWLLQQIAELRVAGAEPALEALARLLAHHGSESSPRVCIHDGRMPTVSAALLAVGGTRVTYRHAEGRPCTQPFTDVSALLALPATGNDETP